VPQVLAGGCFSTVTPTPHTETNIEVVRAFGQARVQIARETPTRFRLDVES
jgi:hypothetical protein